MAQQQLRNDQFFDAPVELFFTVNPAMGISTKMDIAMMMQNVMITAKARDIYACLQAVWNHFHVIVLNRMKNWLQHDDGLCGSWADRQSLYNTTRAS